MKKTIKDVSLSVVIVTKNRKKSLQNCLNSLVFQTQSPAEIVIVDNDSNDGTPEMVRNFSQIVNIPVHLVKEKMNGYPFIYNRGLKAARYPWVAFIDDDCVAAENWIQEHSSFLNAHQDANVIIGESQTISNNIWSLSILILDQHWKKNGVSGNKVIDYEILDNKNIVYSQKFLKENKINFDTKRSSFLLGAAEDSDLGKQIEMNNGKAFFNSKAKIKHQDPTNFKWFLKRYFRSYAAYLYFKEKWPNPPKRSAHIRLNEIIEATMHEYQLNIWRQMSLYVLLFTIVSSSVILSKLIKLQLFRNFFLSYFQ